MNRIRQSALYIYLNTFLEYLCFPWIIPLTANSIGQIVVWGGENPTSSNIWNFLCILQSLNMVLLVTWSRSFVIIVFLQDNWIYVSSEYIWILSHENWIFCLKRFVGNHWKVAMYLEVFHSISLSKKGETYLILRQVRNRKYLLIGQIFFTAVCFSSHISKAVIKFGRQWETAYLENYSTASFSRNSSGYSGKCQDLLIPSYYFQFSFYVSNSKSLVSLHGMYLK